MSNIIPKPDAYPDDPHRNYTGARWIRTLTEGLARVVAGPVIIDLTNVDWVHLFEWNSAAALIHKYLLANNLDVEINLRREAGESNDTLAAFIEAIGTMNELSRGTKSQVTIGSSAQRKTPPNMPTVLMGLMSIRTDEDSLQYLNQRRISEWRSAMLKRFQNAPLLENEAIWRLLSFELTSNIAEHAGGTGFLSAHIVQPKTYVPDFDLVHQFRRQIGGDILNLCVSDAGPGLQATLEQAYKARHGADVGTPEQGRIVAFAFHEIGSRKDFLSSWVSDRHALSRCLHLVEQYGGILRVRTGGYEFRYDVSKAAATRAMDSYGYMPSVAPIEWAANVPGTHLQVLLPLTPQMRTTRSLPLRRALPSRYSVADDYPLGHYVPLSCYFTEEDLAHPELFAAACRRLSDSVLLARPADEPLVIDCDELPLSRRHIQTLVVRLENVLSRRATLLVRVPPLLAQELVDHSLDAPEREATMVNMIWHRVLIRAADSASADLRRLLGATVVAAVQQNEVLIRTPPQLIADAAACGALCVVWRSLAAAAGRGDLSLRLFSGDAQQRTEFVCHAAAPATLDPVVLHDVWDSVIALDTGSRPYVLVNAPADLANAITSLIHTPRSSASLAAELAASLPAELAPSETQIEAALLRCQPLFVRDDQGQWSCCWEQRILNAQSKRSALHDFEHVLKLTNVWHGQSPFRRSAIEPEEKFYLPWADLWVDSFLECGPLFSRHRYLDEIAQRLVSKLLDRIGKDRASVKVFIATTTPALLLAKAIARWWMIRDGARDQLPVLDFGEYHHHGLVVPKQLTGRAIVIQDVITGGDQTNALLRIVEAAGATAMNVAGYVRLEPAAQATLLPSDVSCDVLMTFPAAHRVSGNIGDDNVKVIERRSLRPIEGKRFLTPQYFSPVPNEGTDASDLLRWEVEHFERMRPLIRSGHFAVGLRHHLVAVDFRQLIRSALGVELAEIVAGICLGNPPANAEASSDISIVMMPLDSHVSHLWPKVHERLARAGRMQPVLFVEVASEVGAAPIFLTPRPLRHQARQAASAQAPLRLLFLDDAIITGATTHQVLITIQWAAARASSKEPTIESVQCFYALDRQSRQEHRFSESIRRFGLPEFAVNARAAYSLIGPRPFNESTCPACDELQTVQTVRSLVGMNSPQVKLWCDNRESELQLISLDFPEPERESSNHTDLETALVPIVVTTESPTDTFPSSDLAIARFQQLMALGYPVIRVLKSIKTSAAVSSESIVEHERYRWNVYAWCCRNWKRVTTFPKPGKTAFVKAIKAEIAVGSSVVVQVMAESARRCNEPEIGRIFYKLLETYSGLDVGGFTGIEDKLFHKAVCLETALLVFLGLIRQYEPERWKEFADSVETKSRSEQVTPNRIGLRRVHAITSGIAPAQPRIFALESLAETMARERQLEAQKASAHDMLPKILIRLRQDLKNPHLLYFLREHLSLFIRAAETLEFYSGFFGSGVAEETLQRARDLLAQAKSNRLEFREVRALSEQFTHQPGYFLYAFCQRFNPTVKQLREDLERNRIERGAKELAFDFRIGDGLDSTTLLTDKFRLLNHLLNITIDPVTKRGLSGPSPVIEVDRVNATTGRGRISIDVLTQFATPADTALRLKSAEHYLFDGSELKQWGAEVSLEPVERRGWSVFHLSVPIGF